MEKLNKKMEKLIITYYWGSIASSGIETIPVEYESKKALEDHILNILQAEEKNRKKGNYQQKYFFKVLDYEFSFDEFLDRDFPIEIELLDVWFEKNSLKGDNGK